jgi:hypothetical protein
MLAAAQLRHTIVTKYWVNSLGYVRVLKENTDPILYKPKEHNNIQKNIVISRQRKDCARISSGTKHTASSRRESTDIVSYYYHLIVRNLMEIVAVTLHNLCYESCSNCTAVTLHKLSYVTQSNSTAVTTS